MTWLEKLMDNPYAWAILSLVAIVGFAYSIISQYVNTEKKEFSYAQESLPLIRKRKRAFDKLSIEYDGQQIEDLCVSRFTIWNSGNRTLNHSDMVDTKELTIQTRDENKILDAEIITCSENTNNFTIKIIDYHKLKIFFDYADKKDGIVIQIIHTGTEESLQIDCKIKGGKKIRKHVNEELPKKVRKKVNSSTFYKAFAIYSALMTLVAIFMAIVCTAAIFSKNLQELLFVSKEIESTNNIKYIAIALSGMLWICILFLVVFCIPQIKKALNLGIPKALK